VSIAKIVDRQDIHDVVKQCDNLLYVSHDYYQMTPSKTTML
jgi:hypothetical protein